MLGMQIFYNKYTLSFSEDNVKTSKKKSPVTVRSPLETEFLANLPGFSDEITNLVFPLMKW